MSSKNTELKSYRDPQGKRVFEAAQERKEREERFGLAGEHYDAFYASFTPEGKPGYAFVGGAEGIIGAAIRFAPADDTIALQNAAGDIVATLGQQVSSRIAQHIDAGWEVQLYLSLILYNQTEKRFNAELACICYDRQLGSPIINFTKNIVYRICKGAHPGLELSQEQFARVIQSNGAWYLTKAVPLPKRGANEMVFKSKRQWSEGLVEAAVGGNLGCKIAAVVFWVAVALAAAVAIWWFLLR